MLGGRAGVGLGLELRLAVSPIGWLVKLKLKAKLSVDKSPDP